MKRMLGRLWVYWNLFFVDVFKRRRGRHKACLLFMGAFGEAFFKGAKILLMGLRLLLLTS